MTGSASEFPNTDEATEPLDTSISRPDTYAAHANESASRMQESIARHLEPGDTRATSRRLSDTPDSVRSLFHRESEGEEGGEESKSVLETVHEYVAKALGGGSRGAE